MFLEFWNQCFSNCVEVLGCTVSCCCRVHRQRVETRRPYRTCPLSRNSKASITVVEEYCIQL